MCLCCRYFFCLKGVMPPPGMTTRSVLSSLVSRFTFSVRWDLRPCAEAKKLSSQEQVTPMVGRETIKPRRCVFTEFYCFVAYEFTGDSKSLLSHVDDPGCQCFFHIRVETLPFTVSLFSARHALKVLFLVCPPANHFRTHPILTLSSVLPMLLAVT